MEVYCYLIIKTDFLSVSYLSALISCPKTGALPMTEYEKTYLFPIKECLNCILGFVFLLSAAPDF